MSSPISLPFADYQVGLPAAVAEVAENSLFAFTDASDEATFAEEAASRASAGGDWLRTSIGFAGPAGGRLELTAPVALIRRLCAAFAGAASPNDIGESDLIDFAGELANMVCGTWLTRACQHESFNLTPPRVFRDRPDDPATSAGLGHQAAKALYVSIDDTPIRLRIVEEPAEPCGGREGR